VRVCEEPLGLSYALTISLIFDKARLEQFQKNAYIKGYQVTPAVGVVGNLSQMPNFISRKGDEV